MTQPGPPSLEKDEPANLESGQPTGGESGQSTGGVSGQTSAGVSRQQMLGSAAPSEGLVGKELSDRYVITELLGTGAMGVVYKGRHKLLNREVAIKVLRREASADELSRRRFETEAKAASALSHPNLIAVHDCGFMPDGTPFLVMDYLQGESLGAVLKRERRLEPLRLLSILKQICVGLGYAHAKGLVHRDLKPNNIMLTEYAKGRDLVKIVDFGIVKPVGSDQELTETGQIFGTPFYMSPEQCQGKRLDGRSDIYALGCLVYRVIAGKPPFTGENAVATIVMHVKDPPPAIPSTALDSEVLRALVPIIIKMLAKDPDDRYQTADELRADLERIEHEHATDRMPSVVVVQSPEKPTEAETAPHPWMNGKVLIATAIGCMLLAMLCVGLVGASIFEKKPVAPVAAPVAAGESPHSGTTAAAPQSGLSPAATQRLEHATATPAAVVPAGESPHSGKTVAAPQSGLSTAATQRVEPHRARRSARSNRPVHREHGIKAFFKKIFD